MFPVSLFQFSSIYRLVFLVDSNKAWLGEGTSSLSGPPNDHLGVAKERPTSCSQPPPRVTPLAFPLNFVFIFIFSNVFSAFYTGFSGFLVFHKFSLAFG